MKDLCKKTSTFLNDTIREQLDNFSLLILRLFFGGAMMTHGWGKYSDYETLSSSFPDPLGIGSSSMSLNLAIFGELICPALIVVGLLTRLAAIPAFITMVVAGLIVHADDPFAKKELALAYLVVFAVLIMRGAGKISIDGVWCKKS